MHTTIRPYVFVRHYFHVLRAFASAYSFRNIIPGPIKVLGLSCYVCLFTCFVSIHPALGQGFEDCEIDHRLLKQTILPGIIHADTGAFFYLDPDFLRKEDHPDLFGTVAAHYEYLRPASRKERRQDTIKALTVARVMNDGNVYRAIPPNPSTGFFEVTHYFEGNFTPIRTEPDLLLRPGLIPFDYRFYANTPFVLAEKGDGYFVFRCEQKRIVVYASESNISNIFHTDDTQTQLERKRAYAKSLLGLEVHVSYENDPTQQFIPLELADCRVSRTYTIFSYWGEEVGYLYVDEHTQFRMFEKTCLEKKLNKVKAPRTPLSETANALFNEIVQRKKAVRAVQENPAILPLLMQQFDQAEDDYTGITWYIHKSQNSELTQHSSFLRANLNSNGILYLQSNYFGANPFSHISVRIQIGEKTMLTDIIPTTESRNIQSHTSAGYEEQIHYTRGEDAGIIPFIASQTETPISLIFVNDIGEQKKMELSTENKQAIRDIYLLHLLLTGE